MSMFQILIQEGWIEVIVDVMDKSDTPVIKEISALYFVLFHLFVSTVSKHILDMLFEVFNQICIIYILLLLVKIGIKFISQASA